VMANLRRLGAESRRGIVDRRIEEATTRAGVVARADGTVDVGAGDAEHTSTRRSGGATPSGHGER
jgi:hypothetical protein